MDLSGRFASVAERVGAGDVSASFYPYRELKHTWKVHGDNIAFRISDYLEHSPEDVLDSMAWYLVSRAVGIRCPDGRADRYLAYSRSHELWSSAKGTYLARARNLILDPKGSHRDLSTVFDYVNSNYFACKIRNPVLAWVSESPSRRLGFYFPPLKLLAVNKAFDSESVPRYALEFVIYHELLHHLDAADGRPKRRVVHTKDFKEQERLFTSCSDAEKWLRRIASSGRTRTR